MIGVLCEWCVVCIYMEMIAITIHSIWVFIWALREQCNQFCFWFYALLLLYTHTAEKGHFVNNNFYLFVTVQGNGIIIVDVVFNFLVLASSSSSRLSYISKEIFYCVKWCEEVNEDIFSLFLIGVNETLTNRRLQRSIDKSIKNVQ